MSDTIAATKKTRPANNNSDSYVKTFRQGAIAANVFCRTAPGGLEYLDFSLSRSWKTSTDKEGYSQRFFAKNRDAMKVVVDNACDYIIENSAVGKLEASSDNGKRPDPGTPSA